MIGRQPAPALTPERPIDLPTGRRARQHKQVAHCIHRLRKLPRCHSVYPPPPGQPDLHLGRRVRREPAARGDLDVSLGMSQVPLDRGLLDAGFEQ